MNFNEILFRNIGPNAVWQNLSSKFGCPVLSGQETHMPSPVEPYQILADQLSLFKPVGGGIMPSGYSDLPTALGSMAGLAG